MKSEYKTLLEQVNKQPKAIKKALNTIREMRKGHADSLIHALHEQAFEHINCLECANCCTTTGPLLTGKDIDRIAKHLKLKPNQFINDYLRIDEDNDYVFKTMPCTFLGMYNYCSIYEVRPKACREYPHTDRVNQQGILSITRKNITLCPAVAKIFIEIETSKKS
ncbi:MAG: YkgJ family cysteine cluster protein [Cyclobacteriaceae bacterium]|nr:YkgJ family cysteine cluster protein [Cyclobacteriaceae bacterium]